jgi:hypothetical protein
LSGYVLASGGLRLVYSFAGNRRVPAALAVVGLGLVCAAAFSLDFHALWGGVGPQLSLSLGNSILATRQLSLDLFPDRAPSARAISFTYALMNLVNPFFGGIPTCHGSGGMAGHYAFGGRTGGSVVLYGGFFLVAGLFLSGSFGEIVKASPLPLLGVLLLVEGLTLVARLQDLLQDRRELMVALLVGLIAVFVPFGYAVALVVGTVVARLPQARALSPVASETQ